ncbi:MAG: hypothetical protein PVH29_11170 [Candidatus Zixiibacteriota bacterium]|jgi:hypothetical protein
MRILIYISLAAATLGPAYAADAVETAPETGEEATDPGYVVREEKVINFGTGKVEYEKVIEFPELEILPELSRPVEIIIPRTKPNFDQMPFTIYNNEPSSYLPEEYQLRYYRRVPVDDSLGEIKTGDMFKAPDVEDAGEEGGG